MSKRVLCMILIMLLVFGVLTGCAKQSQAEQTIQNTTSQVQTTTATTTQATTESQVETTEDPMLGNMFKTGLPIVKEPQTFKIIYQTPAASKTPVSEKEICKLLEEQTNVKIEWEEIANAAYAEKLQIMFAAKQLPDAILSNLSDAMITNNAPAILPLNDLLDKYAPNILAAAGTQPKYLKSITFPDGNIYSLGLMYPNPNAPLADRMFINKVWLDKLALKVPETTEELYAVLTAFKQNDPNENGKTDEIPMGFSAKTPRTTSFLSAFGSFGTLDNERHIMVKDGKVVFTPGEREYYDGLLYFSKLMKEGLMDMEGFSQSLQQYNAKGKSGIYGMLFANYPDIQLGEEDVNYITLKPLKGPNGDALWNINVYAAAVPGLEKNKFTIMKRCEFPEVLIRWADHLNSSLDIKNHALYGKENQTWKKMDGEKWMMTQEFVPEGITFAELRQSNSLFTSAPVIYTVAEAANMALDNRVQRLLDDLNNLYLPSLPKEYVSFQFAMDEAMQKEDAILLTDITSYMDNFLATAVLNGITEKDWEEHLNNLKTLNVEKYIQNMQKYYDGQK